LRDLLSQRVGNRANIRSQNPIRLANGAEPEPDVAVVIVYPSDPKVYESRHPIPSETLLVLEVSDSTLSLDLGEKAAMYALHGIADYWVVDLTGHRVMIHRDPTPGGYVNVTSIESGESVSPLAFSDIVFTAGEILG
jgi:Uma2 family endonuclease